MPRRVTSACRRRTLVDVCVEFLSRFASRPTPAPRRSAATQLQTAAARTPLPAVGTQVSADEQVRAFGGPEIPTSFTDKIKLKPRSEVVGIYCALFVGLRASADFVAVLLCEAFPKPELDFVKRAKNP